MEYLNFFQLPNSNELHLKDFGSNKCNKNSLKSCVLEVNFDYPKKLLELHNDYHLAPDKIRIYN